MTTDYHHPYAMYPGYYYCPPYSGSYPPRDQSHHPPTPHHHHHQQQQQQHQQQAAQCSNTYNRTPSGQNVPYHYSMATQRSPYHHQHQPHSSSSSSATSTAGYSSCQQQQHQYSRQSQHQHTPYPSPMVPNFLVSPPGLTPTTLATIEQSFLELQQQQQQIGNQGPGANGRPRGQQQPITQSGFVPPVVDASGHSAEASQDSQDASSDYSDDWEPVKKRGRLDGGASSTGASNVDLIVTSTGATINAAPQRKYTRRNKDEKLSPEEEERRRVRRERNKLAAAKCRQRRVDHTNELVEETEDLERQQSALEQEIATLQQEKEQLEFILQAHQPVCKVVAAQRLQQQQQQQQQQVKVKVERPPSPPPPTSAAVRPHNLSLNTATPSSTTTTTTTSLQPEQGQGQYQPSPTSFSAPSPQALIGGHIESLAVTTRPNSLPLIKRNRARILQASNAAGLISTPTAITPGGSIITTTINTPTSGLSITPSALFCPTLDSIVDGSTGLTPLTGHSCSDQVGVTTSTATTETGTSAADTVGSPTLISL